MNTVCIACIVLGLVIDVLFIRQEYAGNKTKAVILKGLASVMFVALGALLAASSADALFARRILIGLILGLVGDVFLNLRNMVTGKKSMLLFAVGIAAFLAGHFLYIAALIGRSARILVWALPIAAVLSALAIPPLMKNITAPSKGLKIFGIVYLVVVIAMFAFALGLLIVSPALMPVVFTLGALMFVVSDFLMIYFFFGNKKINCLRAINLSTYYVGQVLIALTVLFVK